jgi:hypothetical protein
LLVLNKGLSSDIAFNDSVTSINSLNKNFNMVLFPWGRDLGYLELQCTWEVFVKNSDFAGSIISIELLFGLSVIQFTMEF